MLSAGVRHRGDEFGVHDADEAHDDTAGGEGEQCTERSGVIEPAAGQHDPAEADHRAEADEEDVDRAERLDESVAPILGCRVFVGHESNFLVALIGRGFTWPRKITVLLRAAASL